MALKPTGMEKSAFTYIKPHYPPEDGGSLQTPYEELFLAWAGTITDCLNVLSGRTPPWLGSKSDRECTAI